MSNNTSSYKGVTTARKVWLGLHQVLRFIDQKIAGIVLAFIPFLVYAALTIVGMVLNYHPAVTIHEMLFGKHLWAFAAYILFLPGVYLSFLRRRFPIKEYDAAWIEMTRMKVDETRGLILGGHTVQVKMTQWGKVGNTDRIIEAFHMPRVFAENFRFYWSIRDRDIPGDLKLVPGGTGILFYPKLPRERVVPSW